MVMPCIEPLMPNEESEIDPEWVGISPPSSTAFWCMVRCSIAHWSDGEKSDSRIVIMQPKLGTARE